MASFPSTSPSASPSRSSASSSSPSDSSAMSLSYFHLHPSTAWSCRSKKQSNPHHPLRLSLSLSPSPSPSSSSSSSSSFSYRTFLNFALTETERRTHLLPSPLQEKYSSLTAIDGITDLQMLSYRSPPKIRLLRSLSVQNETMQVLDFAGFASPEYDVPIFCANFFTTANINIIVLDLNPLHNISVRKDYKEKYYEKLIGLGLRYAELLPWGGKLTSESLKFFSPIVIWTKFPSVDCMYENLYSAFTEYYKAWLELIEEAAEETDEAQVVSNREAQHRYLTWRAEKDPGHAVLKRFVGEMRAKDLIRNFLFHGIEELGSKGFLDYFPEYRCQDGTVNQNRSMIGKSFETRPWDATGEFIPNNIES